MQLLLKCEKKKYFLLDELVKKKVFLMHELVICRKALSLYELKQFEERSIPRKILNFGKKKMTQQVYLFHELGNKQCFRMNDV